FTDIAKGKTDFENEYEKVVVAELVKKGYVLEINGKLAVNVRVFKEQEFERFISKFESAVEAVEQNAEKIMNEAERIIKNYIPVHLKKQAYTMAYFRIFEEAISLPVGTLAENKILYPYNGSGLLPTTYIVLNS
ncbi:MAG: hypothetical protein IKL41_04450, partial [Clostridia bacterium]|nr:hypothetical protein [Clostridia bacterium]